MKHHKINKGLCVLILQFRSDQHASYSDESPFQSEDEDSQGELSDEPVTSRSTSQNSARGITLNWLTTQTIGLNLLNRLFKD